MRADDARYVVVVVESSAVSSKCRWRGAVSASPRARPRSMQYSNGGGTMGQLSVPSGAWEDLRREVGAPPGPPPAARPAPRRTPPPRGPGIQTHRRPTARLPFPLRLPRPRARPAATRARPASTPSSSPANVPPADPTPSPPPSPGFLTQARKLEGEIDAKLGAFAKAASGAGAGVRDALLAGDSLDAQAAALETLLQRLADVNAAMRGAATGGESAAARTHTLTRHGEVLAEFEGEFARAKAATAHARERDDLLGRRRVGAAGGASGDGEPFGASSAGSQLIRERATVMGATSRVDDVIGQAQATARELVSQRGILGAAGGALREFGARFGTINNLLVAIKRKRSKDTIVLSGVVAVCTAFTLIYWLSK